MDSEENQEENQDGEWLTRLDGRGWIHNALAELAKTSDSHDPRAMIAGCKRSAGMALNGYLRLEFKESWGRTYVEHLRAAAIDDTLPEVVRGRCMRILHAEPPAGTLVQLRSKRTTNELVEATKDVVAWVYSEVVKREGNP